MPRDKDGFALDPALSQGMKLRGQLPPREPDFWQEREPALRVIRGPRSAELDRIVAKVLEEFRRELRQ